jgi:hypothetical protein
VKILQDTQVINCCAERENIGEEALEEGAHHVENFRPQSATRVIVALGWAVENLRTQELALRELLASSC